LSPGTEDVSFGENGLPDHDLQQITAEVNRTYARVTSARGRIERTVKVVDGEADTLRGRFAVEKPDRLLVELVGGNRQVVGCDGETFRVYFPDQDRGIYRKVADLTSLERFVLGPTPFFGNILALTEDGFSLAVADTVAGNVIIKAVPERPFQFSFVLVAIDPRTWTVRAVEHFDRNNQLVSQTRFQEFEVTGDTLFFPTLVETATVSDRGIVDETTRLSRVQLNVALQGEDLSMPDSPQTVWSLLPLEGPR
jgi:outer membrane lipoprotein-sorting protein